MTKSKKRIAPYIMDKEKCLGKGGFSQVYLCEHQQSGKQYAVKVIIKAQLEKDAYMKRAIQQEMSIHNMLKHQNIVQLVEVLQTSNNIYLIQEFCPNGSLRQLLTNHVQLAQGDALHCLKCLALAFTQIVKKGIIHRDLKPQNILLKQNQLKIADFGFAKRLINHKQLTSTALGTPFYMAPQLLQGKKYSSKCDIWSIGVIYYELLFGTQPWKGNTINQLLKNIRQKPLLFSANISITQQSKHFLSEALQIDESKRLSWLEVYQHKIWNHLGDDQNILREVAMNWRNQYVRAAQKLNKIAQVVQIQVLIGAFLQLQVASLSFQVFKRVMLWLMKVQDDQDVGIMYQLFDKDCNGVIDFEQFIMSFGFQGYKQPILILHFLLQNDHFYEQLKDWNNFMKLTQDYSDQSFSQQGIKMAYSLIKNIIFSS